MNEGTVPEVGLGDLTHAEWARLQPLLPGGGLPGGRWSDHRTVINGILFRLRTGTPWRPASRPASPGWNPQDTAEIARLRKRELELAGTMVTHPYWSEFTAADVLAARTALKDHHERQMADASS